MDKLYNLEKEIIELKLKSYNEKNKHKEKALTVNELNTHIDQIKNDINDSNKERLSDEIEQLMQTIHSMTDEVIIYLFSLIIYHRRIRKWNKNYIIAKN